MAGETDPGRQTMKTLSVIASAALGLLFMATTALAQDVYVNGYYRSDGTYVQPQHRSSPNKRRSGLTIPPGRTP